MALTQGQKGHAAMFLFSALVAGSFSLGAMAANEISPTAMNAARFAIATVVVGTAAMVTGGLPASAARAPWRYVVLALLFTTYFVLMFEGLKTAPAVSAAAVFTLTPAIAGVVGWILLRQITTARMALALAIGATGALWVIFKADWAAVKAFRIGQGEIIYFWGCVAHAIYTPLVRKLNRGERPLVFTFGVLLAGTVLLVGYGWSDLIATDWANLPAIVWITLIYVAIAASSMTFVLLQYATLRLPSSKVMAYTYLTPSWVILWEITLGNGAPQGLVLIGVVMTILALGLLLRDEG